MKKRVIRFVKISDVVKVVPLSLSAVLLITAFSIISCNLFKSPLSGLWQQMGGSITFNEDGTFKSFGLINSELFNGTDLPSHLLLDGQVDGTFTNDSSTITFTPATYFVDIGFMTKSISYSLKSNNSILTLNLDDGSSLTYDKGRD
jgi:hypothetical protein